MCCLISKNSSAGGCPKVNLLVAPNDTLRVGALNSILMRVLKVVSYYLSRSCMFVYLCVMFVVCMCVHL